MQALIEAIITKPIANNFDGCFENVLRISVAIEPNFQCKIHGEVLGYFEIYGKKICGICASNAVEKFINDMNNSIHKYKVVGEYREVYVTYNDLASCAEFIRNAHRNNHSLQLHYEVNPRLSK